MSTTFGPRPINAQCSRLRMELRCRARHASANGTEIKESVKGAGGLEGEMGTARESASASASASATTSATATAHHPSGCLSTLPDLRQRGPGATDRLGTAVIQARLDDLGRQPICRTQRSRWDGARVGCGCGRNVADLTTGRVVVDGSEMKMSDLGPPWDITTFHTVHVLPTDVGSRLESSVESVLMVVVVVMMPGPGRSVGLRSGDGASDTGGRGEAAPSQCGICSRERYSTVGGGQGCSRARLAHSSTRPHSLATWPSPNIG